MAKHILMLHILQAYYSNQKFVTLTLEHPQNSAISLCLGLSLIEEKRQRKVRIPNNERSRRRRNC